MNHGNARGPILKGALGALAASAAVEVARRAAVRHVRRPRVLGIRVPRELSPGSLNPAKLAKNIDRKKVAKRVAAVAEQVEATSEDLRVVSGQAKRLSKKLS